MVIGYGSASWQIVRDLAMRLPAMVLPRWLKSRTRPVALDDVVTALIAAAELPIELSAWFDIPGPEIMSGRQILERIAALRGRRILAVEVPVLTPQLSALWLRLVTRADFTLARELVLGLSEDLLPRDERFWDLIGHKHLVSFDDAARRALANESVRAASERPRYDDVWAYRYIFFTDAWILYYLFVRTFDVRDSLSNGTPRGSDERDGPVGPLDWRANPAEDPARVIGSLPQVLKRPTNS